MTTSKSIEEDCRIGGKTGLFILSLFGSTIPFLPRSCLVFGKNANCGLRSTQYLGLDLSGQNTMNALIFAFKNGWMLV
jgi:hypothetical protein